jgi:hypothetical protein
MGIKEEEQVPIKTIYIDAHGNPLQLFTGDPWGETEIISESDFAALKNKDPENLILTSCNAGHIDFIGSNPASLLAVKVKGAPVLAADGYVAIDSKVRRMRVSADEVFMKYRKSDRESSWVVYRFKDGKLSVSGDGRTVIYGIAEAIKYINSPLPVIEERSYQGAA